MKKKVTEFVRSLGGSTAYQGRTKTMFIKNDPHSFHNEIEEKVLQKFGYGLPFKICTQ